LLRLAPPESEIQVITHKINEAGWIIESIQPAYLFGFLHRFKKLSSEIRKGGVSGCKKTFE